MKTITAIVFAVFATTATASERDMLCEDIANFAHTVMEKRQAGMSMSIMMSAAKDNEFLKSVIVAAYSEPRWNANQSREEAADDFRDNWALACYTDES